jgi:hypothetical protein
MPNPVNSPQTISRCSKEQITYRIRLQIARTGHNNQIASFIRTREIYRQWQGGCIYSFVRSLQRGLEVLAVLRLW